MALGEDKGRKKKPLNEFFRKQLSAFQRSAIKAACVDMWEPLRRGLEKWRPEFRTVYDKFIILQHASCPGAITCS